MRTAAASSVTRTAGSMLSRAIHLGCFDSEKSRLIALKSRASAVVAFMSRQPPGIVQPSGAMNHAHRVRTAMMATPATQARLTRESLSSRAGSGSLWDRTGVKLSIVVRQKPEIYEDRDVF